MSRPGRLRLRERRRGLSMIALTVAIGCSILSILASSLAVIQILRNGP